MSLGRVGHKSVLGPPPPADNRRGGPVYTDPDSGTNRGRRGTPELRRVPSTRRTVKGLFTYKNKTLNPRWK